MKKIILISMLMGALRLVQAQDVDEDLNTSSNKQRVTTTSELQSLGYRMGDAVFIGEINGVKVYRANFSENSRCKGKGKRCKQCPGCCNTGYIDFDEFGTILSVTGGVCGENKIIENGQMYHNAEGETWIKKH